MFVKSIQTTKRYFSFVIIVIFLSLAISFSASSSRNSQQFNECTPGIGWKWGYGPSMPDIANDVQSVISQEGIKTFVQASIFGEFDSCDTFKLREVDFNILIDDYPEQTLNQEETFDLVYRLLQKHMNLQIGRVRFRFPNGDSYFYGISLNSKQNDLSTINPTWLKVLTDDAPPARYTHGMAYDSDRGVSILFGGDSTGSDRLNDTWEFDGVNWTESDPPQSPPGRANIDQTLVFDSHRNKIILFGGLGASAFLNDTWEYDGANWTQINPSTAPQSRDSHAMAFDEIRGVTVLFGGFGGGALNDTWEYDGANWEQINVAQSPPSRFHHAMAYDQNRSVTVLFGGIDDASSELGDTWEFDGSNWASLTPAQSPPARENHTMAYDSDREVILLFGGENDNGVLDDTWEFNGSTWTQINTTQSPQSRKESSLVYDAFNQRATLFGGGYWGDGELTVFPDTWVFQLELDLNFASYLPLVTHYSNQDPDDSIQRNVYVIVYDPSLSNGQLLSEHLNWFNHADLTQQTIDHFEQSSNGIMQYTVVETTLVTSGWPQKTDGFIYTEQEYLDVINGLSPPHVPDSVDYNLIVNDPTFDICGKANDLEIDEVWIYNGPYFGFFESTQVGPDAYWFNSPPVPGPWSCNRLIPIMGPSPERAIDSAVHNFGHRMESTMSQVFGGWQQNSIDHGWEKFALVDAQSPDFDYSGCGSIHYPPNGVVDYDYANSSIAQTNCDDFANYPNLGDPAGTAIPVTCTTWNCTEIGFFIYWYSHLPANPGCDIDDVANHWWQYFASPELALDPSSLCP